MSFYEFIALILAGTAVAISAAALLLTFLWNRKQASFMAAQKLVNESQQVLNEKAILDSKMSAENGLKAIIDIELIDEKVCVSNNGECDAYNIHLFFEKDNVILPSELEDKHPIKRLRPGKQVLFVASVYGEDIFAIKVKATWDDDFSHDNEIEHDLFVN